jgi:hypothetical protein
MVILVILYRYQMSRKLHQDKILKLFKLAAEEDLLLSSWRVKHPMRYSEGESGLLSWREDIKNSLGLTEDGDLERILNGEVDPELLSRASDWSEVSFLIPGGDKIRRKWQKSSDDKGLSGFISWLRGVGSRDVPTILNSIVPRKEEVIKQDSENPQSGGIFESKKIKIEPTSDLEFYKSVLTGIGAPVTDNNLAYLYAWRQSEGGKAAFNPFNTTQKAEGATNYNKVGVKNYTSAEQGIVATIKTITNGRYNSIINSLKMDKPPMETAEALVASPWGTGGLIKKVISGYEAGYSPKPPPIGQVTERIA